MELAKVDVYEVPEVVTFGELDFEPATTVICSTLVYCSGQHGHCSSTVRIVD
ncbi:MAG: hypothetical protein ACYC27_10720 [Armatimonadota bacterium]